VWTGSYNYSLAAELSFENAINFFYQTIAIICMKKIVILFKSSEKIDWNREWMSGVPNCKGHGYT
jgi:hypothetical protein